MTLKNIFLNALLTLGIFINLHAKIERRAAFDLGSGSIKLLVADFNKETHSIEKYIYSHTINISLSDDLANHGNDVFSQKIQERTKDIVHALKLEAEEYQSQKLCKE